MPQPQPPLVSYNDGDLAPGTLIAGRYRIVERISVGVWTSLFRAWQEDLDRLVILKIMHARSIDDPTLVERFRREALFSSQLTHPNTITTYDYGRTQDNIFYIVMEHVTGRTLTTELHQSGALPLQRALAILTQTCRSLAEVHDLGLIHRDLKPDNILLCEPRQGVDAAGDFVKVLDFGVARATRPMDEHSLKSLTQQGVVLGTPLYMSPEQISGDNLTFATDIYAIGHIAWEILAGRHAFADVGSNPTRVMMAHLDRPVPPLPEPLNHHPIATIIRRATARDHQARFPHARALLDALSELHQRSSDDFPAPVMRPVDGFDLTGVSIAAFENALPSRANELGWLARHFASLTLDDTPRIVVLQGEHGIGKSTLVDAFLQTLRGLAEHRPLILNRSEHDDDAIRNGGLWADICLLLNVDDAHETSLNERLSFALGRFSGIHAAQIPAILRLLRRDPGMPSTIVELKDQHRELLAALTLPFAVLSREHLIVWVIEHLQHEDPFTLALLDYIRAHPSPNTRLLVLATLTPEDVKHGSVVARQLRSLLGAEPDRVHTLHLRGLDVSFAADTLEHVLDAPPTPDLARIVHELTGGHPRYMRDVLDELHQRGQLAREHQSWALRDNLSPDELHFTLGEFVGQRILRIASQSVEGQRAVRLMALVALLGGNIPQAWLADFIPRVHDDDLAKSLDRALDAAIHSGYIDVRNQTLRLTSNLARDILVDDLIATATHTHTDGLAAREHLHLAARFLLARLAEPTNPQLQHIVQLLAGAHKHAEAIRVLRHGADTAYRTFHIEAALNNYLLAWRLSQQRQQDGLTAGQAVQHDAEELIVLLRLGELHATLGDIAQADDYLDIALDIARKSPDPTLRATVLGRVLQLQGELAAQRHELDHATRLLEASAQHFHTVQDDHGFARVMVEQAWVLLLEGRPADALDKLLEAEVLAEVNNASAVRARARLYLANAHLQLGQLQSAADSAQISLDLCVKDQNLIGRADALLLLGQLRVFQRDLSAAQSTLGEAVNLKLKLNDRKGLSKAHRLVAFAWAAVGNLDAARGQLQLDIALAQERGDLVGAAWASLLWADVFAEVALRRRARKPERAQADLDEIMGHLDDLSRVSLRSGRFLLWTRAALRRALLLARIERRDEAIQTLHDARAAQPRLPQPLKLELKAMETWLSAAPRTLLDHRAALANLRDDALRANAADAVLLIDLLDARLALDAQLPTDAVDALRHGLVLALQRRLFFEAAAFNELLLRLLNPPPADEPRPPMALSPIVSSPLA